MTFLAVEVHFTKQLSYLPS